MFHKATAARVDEHITINFNANLHLMVAPKPSGSPCFTWGDRLRLPPPVELGAAATAQVDLLTTL